MKKYILSIIIIFLAFCSGKKMYISNIDGAKLYSVNQDVVIDIIPFSSEIIIKSESDKTYDVKWERKEGRINKEDVDIYDYTLNDNSDKSGTSKFIVINAFSKYQLIQYDFVNTKEKKLLKFENSKWNKVDVGLMSDQIMDNIFYIDKDKVGIIILSESDNDKVVEYDGNIFTQLYVSDLPLKLISIKNPVTISDGTFNYVFDNKEKSFVKQKKLEYKDHWIHLKNNKDGTITDINNNLMWYYKSSNNEETWQESLESVKKVSFNGYKDWRLPSLEELASIERDGNLLWCNDYGFEGLTDERYWTSTAFNRDCSKIWYIGGHESGLTILDQNQKLKYLYVRSIDN